jgi:hypothetical protein
VAQAQKMAGRLVQVKKMAAPVKLMVAQMKLTAACTANAD